MISIQKNFRSEINSGNVAKRKVYRFKKPSEGGAFRKRQDLHEASLLIILTCIYLFFIHDFIQQEKKRGNFW